jgi:hypothetical protein
MNNDEKAQKYDMIIEQRKKTVEKYHSTEGGKEARKKASNKYYELHKTKILMRKKLRYEANKLKLENILKDVSV